MPAERRLTSAEIRRKTNKPIMEKRRRERINRCLDELKSIVLRALNEESTPNKLEKADILEMTVRYLRTIRPSRQSVLENSPSKRPGPCLPEHNIQTMKANVKREYMDVLQDKEKIAPPFSGYDVLRHPMESGNHTLPIPAMIPTPFRSTNFQRIAVAAGHPVSLTGKYSPIPVSPISSVSSKSPYREATESTFEEESAYRLHERIEAYSAIKPGALPYINDNHSPAVSPYWSANSSASMSSGRSNDLWSPDNVHNSTIDFQSQSFQLRNKEESFIWRPWGVAS